MKNYHVIDYKRQRWCGFKDYYVKMMYYGDCDPAYPALNYVSDRLELTLEQRYWLSFLYGTNYCVPTTYYIFNEFPDYKNVDLNRLQRWWNNNRHKTFFQVDRRRVKNYNLFVKVFESYKGIMGDSQKETFNKYLRINDLKERYNKVYKLCDNIYYFGRFSLFNYLETLNELTDLKMVPDSLDFKQAESSRNGMCYVCNKDDWVTLHKKKPKKPIDYEYLQEKLDKIMLELKKENPEIDVNYWNIETVLCAYKKLFWKTRYFGYYIDRQMEEIIQLERMVDKGVNWNIFWDFRKEFFIPQLLGEGRGWNVMSSWIGIRSNMMNMFTRTGKLMFKVLPVIDYNRKVKFNSIGDIYAFNIKFNKDIQIQENSSNKDIVGYKNNTFNNKKQQITNLNKWIKSK